MKLVFNKNLSNGLLKKLADAAEIIGAFVEGEAKLRCPVDTGNLRQSITHRVILNDSEFTVKAIIFTNVDYAPYVCFGTIKMDAQPFLRPALLENKQQIIKFIKDNIGKSFREVPDADFEQQSDK